MALFGVASVLCALAPSATLVIVFRAVQGLGAALIFPVSVSVLTNAFPAVRASHAIGLAYGIAGLGNAAGPLIGGLLTETVGWRWIFWLNVPLTLVSLAIGARSITESSDGVAVSGTVPEMLERTGMSTGSAIDLILAVLAALLLPAGAVVLAIARRAVTEAAPLNREE